MTKDKKLELAQRRWELQRQLDEVSAEEAELEGDDNG